MTNTLKKGLAALLLALLAATGCDEGGGGGGGGSIPFRVSNVPTSAALAPDGDIVFNGEMCGPRAEIDTDKGEIRCYTPSQVNPKFKYGVVKAVTQSDGPELTVIVGQNIRLEENNELQIRGQRPLVLVALGNMAIRGKITARDSIYLYRGHAGGAGEPAGELAAGLGAGGGKVTVSGAGAGGGSHCGIGGTGGTKLVGASVGGAGGAMYSNAALVPLRGGSAGGKVSNHSGAGGGAVQLVAAGTLEIGSTGVVDMGGAGGGWLGNGGGSGGAILLEAPMVSVLGVLAVNGAGGGGGAAAGGQDGASAAGSATPALGGAGGAAGGMGGAGSGGAMLNGAPGMDGNPAGGGGGGAGWIRINTMTGTASLTGTLSPSAGSACVSQGMLAAK
jgi:hypothetical protein